MSKLNLKEIREPGGIPAIDKKAEEELRAFVSESKRSNREKNVKHWAFVILLWLGVIAYTFVLFAKVWHLLCSEHYAWLTKNQQDNLNEFLTSSIIGGAVTSLFRAKIGSTDQNDVVK